MASTSSGVDHVAASPASGLSGSSVALKGSIPADALMHPDRLLLAADVEPAAGRFSSAGASLDLLLLSKINQRVNQIN